MFYKPLRLGCILTNFKHWQCAATQGCLHALSGAILLTHTRHDLQNVHHGAFGSRFDHEPQTIIFAHGLLGNKAHRIARLVQHSVDF